MTPYVDHTLAPGEKIICSAHYHWFYWVKRALAYVVILGIGLGIDAISKLPMVATTIAAVLCVLAFIFALILYSYDEMVITNQRVVLKTGIISRDIFEMQIQKVETVLVDQTFAGRIFNYGTIACRGTGGTVSKRIEIEAPLDFRAAFQTAVKEAQQPAASSVSSATGAINEQKLDEIIRLLSEINQKLSSNLMHER